MTLFYCAPCFLDHETGTTRSGRTGSGCCRADLEQAGLLGQCRQPDFKPVSRQRLARVHSPGLYRRGLGVRQVGRGIHRGRHRRQPRQLRRGPDGRRLGLRRRRAAHGGRGHAGAMPGPPARSPCHDRPRDGLLPVQQHRRGRPAGHRRVRTGSGAGGRLGHPPRQRHPSRRFGKTRRSASSRSTASRSIPAPATRTKRAAAAAWDLR